MKRSASASAELRHQEHELASAVAAFDLGEDDSYGSPIAPHQPRQVGVGQISPVKRGYRSLS